jgi:hypothetical protein
MTSGGSRVLARVIVQQTQLPDALVDAELDRYLHLLGTGATTVSSPDTSAGA